MEQKRAATYYPLVLIFIFLVGGDLLSSLKAHDFSAPTLMSNFMGGFFVVFSFFKLLDIKGFAKSYRGYDVLAKRFLAYGYLYPFIELALGIAYLVGFNPLVTNSVTAIVMAIGSIGVLQSILNKQKIKCACLGTVFNLPMSTVTLIEDLLMLFMALAMIV